MSEQTTQWRLPRKWCEEVWFPALLSGEYKQGTDALCTYECDIKGERIPGTDAYCCLGVGAAAMGIEKSYLYHLSFVEYYGHIDNPGNRLVQLGKEADAKGYPSELYWSGTWKGSLAEALAELNDSKGYTFAMIVDWVKENVELYDEEI